MIRVSEVMLIDQDGVKQGIMNTQEALKIAQNSSLDLVQVSSNDASPIVCKILDYGKHLFQRKSNSNLNQRLEIIIKGNKI